MRSANAMRLSTPSVPHIHAIRRLRLSFSVIVLTGLGLLIEFFAINYLLYGLLFSAAGCGSGVSGHVVADVCIHCFIDFGVELFKDCL